MMYRGTRVGVEATTIKVSQFPAPRKGGKGKEEGFITVFSYIPSSQLANFDFFLSKRNRPFDTRVSISLPLRCNAINVYRDWRSKSREGHGTTAWSCRKSPYRQVGAKVLAFEKVWFRFLVAEIYFRFWWRFLTRGEARYVETGIRLTRSMQRDTKAERLVDHD